MSSYVADHPLSTWFWFKAVVLDGFMVLALVTSTAGMAIFMFVLSLVCVLIGAMFRMFDA